MLKHLLACTALLLTAHARAQGTAESAPLNVVIIYADDMGFGDMSCQNPDSKIPTPHLDALAAQGMRLTDAHSSSGICTPSRYALLTGRYHWRQMHGIAGPLGGPVFDDGRVTIAHVLQDAGYDTQCIGKWHLGWDWAAIRHPDAEPVRNNVWGPDAFDWSAPIPGGPLDRGFDHYFGDGTINFPPYTWIEDDHVAIVPTQLLDLAGQHTVEGNWECRPGPAAPDWDFYNIFPTLIDRAEAFVQNRAGNDTPFFLYFPLPAPHAPIIPTDEYRGRSDAGGYGDFVVMVDDAVGRVLAALDESGHADNTLVVFTADNGPEVYCYARAQNLGHFSMLNLRGIKRDVFEGGHRVPTLVRWPGVVEPGTVSDALFGQIDLFATIASATGQAIPDNAAPDSLDQTPTLRGTATEPVRAQLVHNTYPGKWALRDGDWLYLNAPNGDHRQVPQWFRDLRGYEDHPHPAALYNLRDDPEQLHNLYADESERVESMAETLDELRADAVSAR